MLFLPIADDNPTLRRPIVTIGLIVACILVHLWQRSLGEAGGQTAIYVLGVIPAVLFGQASLPPDWPAVPALATIFTSMFLHGGWLHLAGNMLFLWIFGNNVEDSMGRGRFLLFYLLCGVAAALAQAISAPGSSVPMVGASGAIGGVLGAYMLLHPLANVRVFAWIIIIVRIVNVPAVLVLGLWFAGQVLSGVSTPTSGGGVAFWAHVGGFLAGALLIPFFRHRGVRLLQPAHSRAFTTVPRPVLRRGSVPMAGNARRPWGDRL
ncbi:rhomboid family intramembrane serine protease [Oleisolibacter albus]|uniref:rhomboid family intramembrane serine protease n=1 Tax=Oleisolibacter albus TaxID=2171757 RepID=UPI000DF451A6|nr:rhomboid family intramembrane serine protease [Oleisolibacter albus]